MSAAARTVLTACALIAAGHGAWAQDQAAIGAGERIYDENCAACHGEKLRNPTAGADLRELGAGDRLRFDKAVAEGKGQMPSWTGVLSAEELDQVWAYIRSRAK